MKAWKILLLISTFLFWQVAHAHGEPITLTAPSLPGQLGEGSSNAFTYTLNNHTLVAIKITQIAVTGSNSATITTGCSIVPAMKSCSFTVTVTPTAQDTVNGIHGTLNVTYDGRLPHPQITSALNFTVQTAFAINISAPVPAPVNTMVSGTTQTLTYTITNTGFMVIPAIMISGFSGNVSVVNNTCLGALAPAASCTFGLAIGPQAEDIGILQQTINIDFGGTAPASIPVGPLAITNPTIVATGSNGGNAVAYASTDLGQTWTNITAAIPLSLPTVTITAIAGGATLDTNNQLLNDTLFLSTNNTNGEAHYLTATGAAWATTTFTNHTALSFPSALGYGNNNGSATFFSGITSGVLPLFAYSADGSDLTETGQTGVINTTPTAAGFGGGFYLLGFAGAPAQVYYTADPTTVWTATPPPVFASITAIAYSPAVNTWVAVVGANALYTSSLPAGWNSVVVAPGGVLRGVIYNDLLGQFVSIDNSGSYYTSADGQTWSAAQPTGSGPVLTNITYSRSTGVMIITNNQSDIFYSSGNIINWIQATGTGVGNNFTRIASSTST